MPPPSRIIDNRSRTAEDYLRHALDGATDLRMVTAYFTIYGYSLLAKKLNALRQVRFLFGEPASVNSMDPTGQEYKAFQLTEQGLTPAQTLRQGRWAKRCAEWLAGDGVAVRSVRKSNFLHGKLYLAGDAALVGSSNFTRNGLGSGNRPNVEIKPGSG